MITKKFKNCVNNHGFTLIELLVSLALTVLVLSGIYELYTSQSKAYNAQNQVAEMQQNVRIAMDVIARSIRSAGYDPLESGFFGFTDSAFKDADDPGLIINEQVGGQDTLFLTVNDDGIAGIADTVDEKIGYRLTGGNLQIGTAIAAGVISAWSDLAENISTLTITYTMADGNNYVPDNTNGATPLDNTDQIRLVKVTIMGKTSKRDPSWPNDDGAGVGYRTRTLSSNVRPRNY